MSSSKCAESAISLWSMVRKKLTVGETENQETTGSVNRTTRMVTHLSNQWVLGAPSPGLCGLPRSRRKWGCAAMRGLFCTEGALLYQGIDSRSSYDSLSKYGERRPKWWCLLPWFNRKKTYGMSMNIWRVSQHKQPTGICRDSCVPGWATTHSMM